MEQPAFPAPSDIVPEYGSRNPAVRWLFHRRLEVAARLGELGGERPLRVLDLGCGAGVFLRLLRERFARHSLEGLDYNPQAAAVSVPGVSIREGDLSKPGLLPAGAYDRIFCLDVLEHLRDLSTPLASIREGLAPGGLLVVSAPSENAFHKLCRFLIKGTFSEIEGPASSPHFHRAASLRESIAAAGFQPLERVCLPAGGPLTLLELQAFRKRAAASAHSPTMSTGITGSR